MIKIDNSLWKIMKVGKMEVNEMHESGMDMDENGWYWMKMDEGGWK